MFDAYHPYVVCDEGFENIYVGGKPVGFRLRSRFHSYRGTYLSCIRKFGLAIDGVMIPAECVLFCLNGKKFRLAELPSLSSEYWYVLDEAVIEVYRNHGLAEGEHEVTVTLEDLIPYTGYDGECIVSPCTTTKKLLLRGR